MMSLLNISIDCSCYYWFTVCVHILSPYRWKGRAVKLYNHWLIHDGVPCRTSPPYLMNQGLHLMIVVLSITWILCVCICARNLRRIIIEFKKELGINLHYKQGHHSSWHEIVYKSFKNLISTFGRQYIMQS